MVLGRANLDRLRISLGEPCRNNWFTDVGRDTHGIFRARVGLAPGRKHNYSAPTGSDISFRFNWQPSDHAPKGYTYVTEAKG